MLIPWTWRRCIVCRRMGRLTKEHVIPKALGGKLQCAFMCGDCNGRLGHASEAQAREDPEIRLLAEQLRPSVPELAVFIGERQSYFGHSAGGKVRGFLRNGEFRAASGVQPDGTLVQDTSAARDSIARMLSKDGISGPLFEEVVQRFDEAQENERVRLTNDIEVIKWRVDGLSLDLKGPLIGPVIAIKAAAEFIAVHLGELFYEDVPPLAEIRRVLSGGKHDPSRIEVVRLTAAVARPLHGIIFEGNHPESRVQVRLFGKIALRVTFKGLSVGGPRGLYTHDLTDGSETVNALDS